MGEIRKKCISVIVAIYNMEFWLERCIQSIMNQTYDNLEILLIDDGSTDGSGRICESCQSKDSRITWLRKENGGVSDARNYGIVRTHGEYIAFVDPDDWIEESFFEKLMLQMEGGSEPADMACVGFDYVWGDGRRLQGERVREIKMDRAECLKELCRNKWFTSHVWNKMYRRKLFDGVMFPEKHNYEDIAIMHELVMKADLIVCSGEILYHYYMRQESIIHVQSAENEMDNFLAYRRRFMAVENCQLKRLVLKCCAWSAYRILYLSENRFEENEYEEVMRFWQENTDIRFLGVKYILMYTFPELYKKYLRQ